MTDTNHINYFEFDADNPTLNQLILFTRVHNDRFNDIDLTVLAEYEKITRKSWSKGRYYLYGQLQVLPDTPITRQILDDAKSLHLQRVHEYGEPYSSVEAASIRESEQFYHRLIEIIERYRFIYNDVMYNPVNGIEYLRAKERFERSQGKV
jgi:hypothetical protein